ncbi:hypothetical protein [Niallia endozanthoxylica]|nr:hypothetical protein [Niallia endozanthoxylica]
MKKTTRLTNSPEETRVFEQMKEASEEHIKGANDPIEKLLQKQKQLKERIETHGHVQIKTNVIQATYEEVKKSAREDIKHLAEYEIVPKEEYKTGKRRHIRPRLCFQQAFRYVANKANIEGIRLVHGLYKPSSFDNHCDHAWVELPDGTIFDGVLQRFYEKEGYYNYYQIIKNKEYNHTEMYKIGLKHGGTFGPWYNDIE